MTSRPYVPGSNDRRAFALRGVSLYVVRGAGRRVIGFEGSGPEGDFVPAGAKEPAVLDAMVTGTRFTRFSACEYEVESEADLDIIEARLELESGGPSTIVCTSAGSLDAALALIDVPMSSGMSRSWSVSGSWVLNVSIPVRGDATATPWAWGRDPGDWLVTTLAQLDVGVTARSGTGNGATLTIARDAVHALLERALSSPTLGPNELQLTDA